MPIALGLLQMRSTSQCAYLAGEGPEGLGPALRHVGVFLCADELRGRGVYGLHLPMRQRRAAVSREDRHGARCTACRQRFRWLPPQLPLANCMLPSA